MVFWNLARPIFISMTYLNIKPTDKSSRRTKGVIIIRETI